MVAAYPTTGKEIREWDQARTPPGGPSVSPAPDWAQHPDETRLTVCIVDDVLMKGSPDGDNLNRSIIFVTGDGTPQPAITTMPGNLPPNGAPEPDDR